MGPHIKAILYKTDAQRLGIFEDLIGQNTKGIIYEIRREAPVNLWRTLLGQNTKEILYKIRYGFLQGIPLRDHVMGFVKESRYGIC